MRTRLLVAALLLAVPLASAQNASTVPIEHRFEGHFRCMLWRPGPPSETCVSNENRKNETTLWLNQSWSRLEVDLAWNPLGEGKDLSRLWLKIAAPSANLSVSAGGSWLVQHNITHPGRAISMFRIWVERPPLNESAPRSYDQSFNITMRAYPAQSRGDAGPTSQPAPATSADTRPISRESPFVFDGVSPASAPIDTGTTPERILFISPLALLVLLWEPLRTKLLVGAWAAGRLFARQPPQRLLEHPRRALLVNLVERYPGVRPHELQSMAELANGPFRFHLQVLLRNGFLRRERTRGQVFLFAASATSAASSQDIESRVQELVKQRPGISQVELAALLGMPRKTLHYHITRLRRSRRIEVRQDGRLTRIYWNG